MKRWFVPGLLAILALALGLRLPELRLRPLHNDESVNALKFRSLWTENNYRYDPNEFHGPTLPYFTLPAAIFHGSHEFNDFSEATFRMVDVVFGAGLIILLLFLTPELGGAETLWAAAFLALSPAMVFYSRYYIHEMLLVFFTGLAAISWWRYLRSGRFGWCVLAGAGLGLMSATKETFVVPVLSMGLAAVGTGLIQLKERARVQPSPRASLRGERADTPVPGEGFLHFFPPQSIKNCCKPIAIALGVAAVIALLFFSSFFTNAAGIADAIKTYTPWLHRAEGVSPHVHPWYYYLQHLFFYHASGGPFWSEGLIAVLAVVGGIAGLTGKGLGSASVPLVRFIAFYTASMTIIYAALPYKTPWCLLGFLHGFILLAGVGAAALVRACKSPLPRSGMIILLVAATTQLGWQAWRANFGVDKGGVPYCDSQKNPYTYSQTAPDIFRLTQTVEALAKISSEGYSTVIEVMSPDSYWPLPWYLRRFKNVGYWDKLAPTPPSTIMIVSTALHAGYDERPARTHLMAGYFELRPNVFFELYVNVDLWAKYLKTLPKEAE